MIIQKDKECRHNRVKRNYPHGKKSSPVMFCKDCNEVVTPLKLKQIKRNTRKKR